MADAVACHCEVRMMRKDDVIALLTQSKPQLAAKYGVTQLGVFGSLARNEASGASDIDIVVHMPPDLFLMVHMKEELEQLLHAPVDLVRYQKHLNVLLKSRIDREAIYV
jgi:predicted nucleotidyltransferase